MDDQITPRFRVIIYRDDRVLGQSEFTFDREAVIECVDNINGHKTYSLSAYGSLIDDNIKIVKGGHTLVEFVMEKMPLSVELMHEFNYHRGKRIKASIETAVASDEAIRKMPS